VIDAFLASIRLGTHRPARLAVAIRLSAGRLSEADLHLRPPREESGAAATHPGATLVLIEPRTAAGVSAGVRESIDIDAGSIAGEAVLICRNEAIVHAEEAAARMVGIPASELTGRTIKDFVGPEDLLPVVEALRSVEKDEGRTSEFGFHLSRTGNRSPLEVAARVRATSWKGAPAVAVVLRDISRELRNARFATERIEHLNAALAASSEAVIVLGDPSRDWPVTLVTKGVGKLFDRDISGWTGRPFREVEDVAIAIRRAGDRGEDLARDARRS
jgi:PAS domain S-box-containing protein